MKSRDWFIVGVRLFGVWMLLSCVSEAVTGLETRFAMVTLRASTEAAYWLHGGIDLFVGLALLIYGRTLAAFFDWDFTPPNHCEKCGYDLRETPDKCPECGSVPSHSG